MVSQNRIDVSIGKVLRLKPNVGMDPFIGWYDSIYKDKGDVVMVAVITPELRG
jgi:hypothetical protein